MQSEIWLNSAEFAEVERISVQAARAALRRAAQGHAWRGRRLEVRVAPGRGGQRGLIYLVKAPPGETACVEAPGRPHTIVDPQASLRAELVGQVLAHAKNRQQRSAAVSRGAIAAGVSRRSIYRWLARYEANGLRGLKRASPDNAGRPRVWVSRVFDQEVLAAGCSAAVLEEIGHDLKQVLRGLWASRAEQAGGGEVRRLAEAALHEICEHKGVSVPNLTMRVSRRQVERFSAYRVINQRRNDRKAFDDAKPRIRRDWSALLPMEQVIADVKHLDVLVTRDDGTPAWPKIIAFMDAGTGRVFVHPLLLERGEGVRQEHVIEAFLAMVADPTWGFPQSVYLDNGVEFAALTKIDAALQLISAPGARTLIFARPYNAAAKPVESLFARLDRQVFALLPGYAGPNRLAKKTQTVGKPPLPYPGDWDDFRRTLQGLIRAHNHRPIGGARGRKSPEQALQAKAAQGWRPVQVDPLEIDLAFSDPDSRRVDRGVLKIKGVRFTHERLAALPSRTTVDLALPWRSGAAPLARVEGSWVYLQPETLFPARWIEGARISAQRQRAQARHVSTLEREAPVIDPVALKIRWGERQPRFEAPPTPGSLDLGREIRGRAADLRSAAVAPPALTEAEIRRAREMAITERLERAQQRDD